MIYTVGHKKNYLAAISEHGEILKMGEKVDYSGGIVFESVDDAQRYLEECNKSDIWCVWGVDADWVCDTYPASDGWWSYLLFDSVIISLGDTNDHL